MAQYSSKSLATKYRPVSFKEMVGQSTITDILENQIKTKTFRNTVLFTGPAGCGKAQPLTANVLTLNGYKLMRDIEIGDKVVDGTGNITTVDGVYPQGIRPIYRITFNDRSFIDVSDEHLNYVYRYNEDKKCREYFTLTTTQLIELFNKTRFNLRVDTPVLNCWECSNLPINPYLVGALIGDGSLSNNFSFSNSEEDIITRVDNLLQLYNYHLRKVGNVDFSICQVVDKGYNQFTKSYNFLHRTLEQFGLMTQSYNKHIPKEYLFTTVENRLELLRGLFDTDGYIDKNNQYEYTTTSPKLSEDFAFLVRSLGIVDTITVGMGSYKQNRKLRQTRPYYTHRLKVPNDLIIVSSKKHLERRKLKQTYPIRKIVAIDRVEDATCQCIHVTSECHTYITDNVTVTHNTTSARAFARLLNNGKGKPIEIDAASNNGVDNVRDIIAKAQQKSLDSEYKVFILDEVHMLSIGAWNALLKLIEEPPANTIFIFCTTDAQKIPATIISRVQRFDFKRISFEDIVNRLKYVIYQERREKLITQLQSENLTDDEIDIQLCQAEDSDYFDVDENAVGFIAKTSAGGMRDALTLLDKCMAYSDQLTLENVVKALGSVDYSVYFNLTNAIIDYKEQEVINIIETCYRDGSDLKQFIKNYTIFLLDVCKYCICKDFEYIQIPEMYKQDLDTLVNDKDFIKYLLSEINKLNSDIKWEASVKSIVELKLLALTQPENN